MCEPSIVTDDWVTKGFHIHIGGVELRVYPDHLGGLGFDSVFSGTPQPQVNSAIKTAYNKCLVDPTIRKSWLRALARANAHMLSVRGELQSLASGRMGEFKFLEVAIRRWGT